MCFAKDEWNAERQRHHLQARRKEMRKIKCKRKAEKVKMDVGRDEVMALRQKRQQKEGSVGPWALEFLLRKGSKTKAAMALTSKVVFWIKKGRKRLALGERIEKSGGGFCNTGRVF